MMWKGMERDRSVMIWNKYPEVKPIRLGHYLVFNGDHVFTCEWSSDPIKSDRKCTWMYKTCCSDEEVDSITHWMELPEGPKE